ncbi:hypothetical protein [Hyphomicrobium sp.]|uniref:hypothetical protein n=1 Tax=Hyphomicrobium sp. TaxID=82 RepID=UPI0025B9FB85|nr:hypothetical protein [Hyphomicrobium sp.]MCC7250541.1 hypothetical protein [Hyphomicrobium sp.]
MCSKEPALTDIQVANIGEMERTWLYLIRLQCMSYEHNHAEGWDRAIGHAEAQYGADDGPEIASRIAVLIRAMRVERKGGFGYLSPFCPNCRVRVTEDEWQLILLMQAGYRGEPGVIEEAAAEFARRTEAPVLAAAATRFGSTIAAVVRPPRSRTNPAAMLH